MGLLIALACAVASISFTVTQTGIFEWLRALVERLGVRKLTELIHCPYCFGHWVTFILLLVLGPRFWLDVSVRIVDFFVTAFAIMGVVGVLHYVLLRAYAPVAQREMERELAALQAGDAE